MNALVTREHLRAVRNGKRVLNASRYIIAPTMQGINGGYRAFYGQVGSLRPGCRRARWRVPGRAGAAIGPTGLPRP